MKQRIKFIRKGIFLLLLFLIGTTKAGIQEVRAASMYEDAKLFFESTGKDGEEYHAACYNGNIYYATQAKLASSSSNLKYGTVGYDITVRGEDGTEISFGVKRVADGSGVTGSMAEVPNSRVYANGYEYNLYAISSDRLYDIMEAKDAAKAAIIRNSSIINVYIDAIMTTKKNGTIHGDVTEVSAGTLMEWHSENLYHLKNESEWNALKKIFSGHYFKSFRDIEEKIKNHTLKINYDLEGGTPTAGGSTVVDDMLYTNGSMHITSMKILQKGFLVGTGSRRYPGREISINVQKTGYHLEEGKEWISKYNRAVFSDDVLYSPKELYPPIADGSHGLTMIANWQPITYIIKYDTNGGDGIFADQQMTYDKEGRIHPKSTRTGYVFQGWKNKATGEIYEAGQSVKNLAETDGAVVRLTAVWEAQVYKITTDKQGGTGGLGAFYEKYNVGWYSDKTAKNSISSIAVPNRTGHRFTGYWTAPRAGGQMIVKADGTIGVKPVTFEADAVIYAAWEPMKYTITFDKQGGTGGTDKATATYGKALPEASAPVKTGYSFQGYFTGEGGTGTKYYDENMNGLLNYKVAGDLTLYAFWKDDLAPRVQASAEPGNWTNGVDNKNKYGVQCVYVNISASDDGEGLEAVNLYRGTKADAGSLVKAYTGLNGKKTYTVKFPHTEEGAVAYTVQAVDKKKNKAEARTTVKYDVTAPKMDTDNMKYTDDGERVEIELFVTDY